jgi:DNA-binding GntR family transcriptional regulator
LTSRVVYYTRNYLELKWNKSLSMIGNDKIHAIFRTLVEEIASGKYIVGQRLPTDKELAKTFNTSRINVFRALEQLKQLGIISSRKRAGTVVIAMPNAELIQQLLNDSSKVVYCLISSKVNYHLQNREQKSL